MSSFSWDWAYAWSVVPQLLQGLKVTIWATIWASVLALLLGMVWTLLRLARVPVLSELAWFFVEFVRGTPLLVQIYFLFYVFPTWGITFSAMVTGIIALAVFNSAYVAEIYRAGIEDLPKGQWEAALTLGLPIRRVWLGIILPQSLRAVLPMLGNVVIGMFKETSILSTITVFELLAQGMDAGTYTFRFVEPLTLVGAFYFVISYIAARGVRTMEIRHAARD